MKKTICLTLTVCLFALTACGRNKEQESFSLTAEEQAKFTEEIDRITEEFYWDYDRDSLVFGNGIVPEDTSDHDDFFQASADSGYQLKNKAGSQSVVGTAKLLHYNGDDAGEISFVFIGDALSGVYYKGGYDNSVYSLKERNPFLADGDFEKFEQWQGMSMAYWESGGNLPQDGFVSTGTDDKGRGIAASIRDGRVELYRLSGSTLSRSRTLTPSGGLEAVSAVFVGSGKENQLLAVLLAEVTESGEGEGEKIFSRSEKVALYDTNFKTVGEIPLESDRCTALGADGDTLLLFVDKAVETYEAGEDGWQRTGRESLKHAVTQCHVTDLDGNGEMEYLMTDGMDLYLYHKTDLGMLKIWSTHLGVESLYGALYSGDLNGDGVKEVYVCDATGTAIRYILTEKGLRSFNEDIEYGQAIYPCDFNGDGTDDYWKVLDSTERKGKLFLSNNASR